MTGGPVALGGAGAWGTALAIAAYEKAVAVDKDQSNAIARIKPKSKRRTIEAIAATVTHDGVITATEAELLRGVADALGCPMPPLQGTATSA